MKETIMLHNKYEPKSFKDMIGSKVVLDKLQGYIEDKNIPHCLLFYGERGCGKSSSSMIIANSIEEAYIEIIDASVDNGVDVSRHIASTASEIPLGCKNKVYIFEEIHSVSDKFYDALLLITNNPPSNTYFIICTTEVKKIRSTVRSRFIEYNFKPTSSKEMRDYLQEICTAEDIKTDRKVLTQICKNNNNIPRDCLTSLELIIGVENIDDQMELIENNIVDEKSIGYQIASSIGKISWSKMRLLLEKVNLSDVEGIRIMALNYYAKVLIGDVKEEYAEASLIIEDFKEPFYDSRLGGLFTAIYLHS